MLANLVMLSGTHGQTEQARVLVERGCLSSFSRWLCRRCAFLFHGCTTVLVLLDSGTESLGILSVVLQLAILHFVWSVFLECLEAQSRAPAEHQASSHNKAVLDESTQIA